MMAGGTHHSCFSYDLTPEYWEDYAEIADIEMLHIGRETTLKGFKRDLKNQRNLLSAQQSSKVTWKICNRP